MSESSKILSTPIKLSSSNTSLIATSFKLREAMIATSTAGCNERHVSGTQVPDRYLARSKLVEVRETPEQLITGSKWDQLSSAIWTKFINNQQTTNDYVNKMTLFKHLYSHIKVCLRYSVFVVGSTFNGFGTSSSDLDLCLVIRNQQLLDLRADAIHHLINTLQLFSRINYTGTEFQKLELIEAKVPLLKFHHSLGVDVDVNCNNSVGIRNTHLLHCYSMADWRVKPLVLVVKLWAQYHEINDAKNMTISSYSLALMVIHFLQLPTSDYTDVHKTCKKSQCPTTRTYVKCARRASVRLHGRVLKYS
ncbi:Zinc finger, CCHC domain-containing protein [Homalodisca vitripennis]|nr:Zinc finger, CCHC domain-containing protein [Homalodisca vitripennis]